MHKSAQRADAALFRGPMPRYAQLADIFRQRIVRNRWPPGTKLPSLEALMGEFEVARVTVRQAMELLARDGLVSAERGRGTFVKAAPSRDRGLMLETSLQALADVYRNDTPNLTLIDEAAASPRLFERDGAPAPRYRFMRRVHSRHGEAYCVISIYLDERVFRMAPRRFRRETVIPVLLELPRVSVARAWQTVEIGTADVTVARHLGIPATAPVAEERRVCQDRHGTVIYLGEVTYRGDYIHLEMDLKP
jgi:GntR family transcriptional regulator